MTTLSAAAITFILCIVLVFAAHTLHLRRRGRWFALDPLNAFWAGVFVCYVQQPLSFGAIYAAWHEPGTLEKALLWIFAGIVAVVCGYESRFGGKWTRRLPAMPEKLSNRGLAVTALLLIGAGVAGYLYLISSAGSLARWASAPRGNTDWESVSGYGSGLVNLLPIGTALLVFEATLHRRPLLHRTAAWGLALVVWVWGVYMGTRGGTIGLTLALLAAHFLPRRRNPSLALLGTIGVGLLLLVSFQARYRGYFTDFSFHLEDIDWNEAANNVLPTWLGGTKERDTVDTSPYAEFNCVMAAVELVPDKIPYNWGYSHLELFTRPIPRAVWPDKRYPHAEAYTPIYREGHLSDYVILTTHDTLLMGPSFTMVGHWWTVGGPIAVIVCCFLSGVFFKAIRTVYDRQPGNEGDLVLYSSLIILGFTELATEPLFWLYSLPLTHGPLFLLLYMCRARRRRPSASGGGRVAGSCAGY